ncbi:hypothetical protein M407DRAFT_242052 [Tulasnella calospora MUT 4182]|uniref:Uncharacterized protein n=1 Tax=Tulasnella calospora MUT 4182 TaxID=1051891 RepID=A0A0C3LA88_9AGAM|nr:hypothetical protein M407DRAFT_242052 [Tulasnella calospora MUT 4182]
MELCDAWKWPKLTLTMIQERWGSSQKEPGDPGVGGRKWHPSPLTALRLNGMNSNHPDTFYDISCIVGEEALDESSPDMETTRM